MSGFLTIDDLTKARSRHKANLDLLQSHSKSWDERTAIRGEATMANLTQQICDIDDELRFANMKTRAQA